LTPLPQPRDLTSLVLRSDFSDDAAWDAIRATIDAADEHPAATYVSDPAFAGVTIESLIEVDAAASDDDKLTYVFCADAVTMAGEDHPLLVVDLYDDPGYAFRVPLRWFADVSANLAIANLDFDDFAGSRDDSSTYRGFE